MYSFVTVGEAIAWTTGWQLLLECAFNVALPRSLAWPCAACWHTHADVPTGLPPLIFCKTAPPPPPLPLADIIGASTVARAWSGYLDSLSGGVISNWMTDHIPPMNVPGLAQEVDFLAFGITMLLTCVCAFGAKESSLVNNFLTGTNVLVIGFTIIAGAFYAKPENYVPFAPHPGLIFGGAATSFFAYVGACRSTAKRG